MDIIIVIVAAVGFILSFYAYLVEEKIKKNGSYKAFCDINNRSSCSKAFTSPYGSLLGISNSLLGIFFYVAIIGFTFFGLNNFVYYLTIAGVISSVILAYLLYAKVRTFCLVCTSIYIINITLFLLTMRS